MKVTRATVAAHGEVATAALANERLTRQRVEMIEAVLGRGFFGRLRWLFLGR